MTTKLPEQGLWGYPKVEILKLYFSYSFLWRTPALSRRTLMFRTLLKTAQENKRNRGKNVGQ